MPDDDIDALFDDEAAPVGSALQFPARRRHVDPRARATRLPVALGLKPQVPSEGVGQSAVGFTD